jgi:hypothetical protein
MRRKVWWVVAAAIAAAVLVWAWNRYSMPCSVEVRPSRLSILKGSEVVIGGEEIEFIIRDLEKLTEHANFLNINVYELSGPLIEVRFGNGSVLQEKCERFRVALEGDTIVSVVRVRGVPKEAGRQVVVTLELEQGRHRAAFVVTRPVVMPDYWRTEALVIMVSVLTVALAAAVVYIIKQLREW